MPKINFMIFVLLFSFLCFSQKTEKRNNLIIFLDLKDKTIKEYTIDKDTLNAFFNIYIEKYQSQKERDKAIKNYQNQIGDPNSAGIPDFSIGFYAFDRKPEYLKSLDGIRYITIKEFRKTNYHTTSPTYIIHKLKNGNYLMWKTNTMY